MSRPQLIVVGILVVVLVLSGIFFLRGSGGSSTPEVLPTVVPTAPPAAQQLTEEQLPTVAVQFSQDAHYVTVNISGLQAAQLEYDLIYDATVKGQKLQTGVNASYDLRGKTTYSERQLLGSESNGKFSYHTNIQNATLNLTLRDASRRSIYTAVYPFTVKAGSSSELTPVSE